MGRLIEESKVIEILQTSWLNGTIAHRIIDEIKQRIKLEALTVEAIPKADYEIRLKADMVAILTEIQLEIRELWDNDPSYVEGVYDSEMIIQQKINALKAESEVEDGDNTTDV